MLAERPRDIVLRTLRMADERAVDQPRGSAMSLKGQSILEAQIFTPDIFAAPSGMGASTTPAGSTWPIA